MCLKPASGTFFVRGMKRARRDWWLFFSAVNCALMCSAYSVIFWNVSIIRVLFRVFFFFNSIHLHYRKLDIFFFAITLDFVFINNFLYYSSYTVVTSVCVDCKTSNDLYCWIPFYYCFYLFPSICVFFIGWFSYYEEPCTMHSKQPSSCIFMHNRSLWFKDGHRI